MIVVVYIAALPPLPDIGHLLSVLAAARWYRAPSLVWRRAQRLVLAAAVRVPAILRRADDACPAPAPWRAAMLARHTGRSKERTPGHR